MSTTAITAAAVGLGAACGAWARWGLSLWLNGLHPRFPVGTWVANLAGALLIGVALAWFAREPAISSFWRPLLITGFLGALTTFSTFSAEALALIEGGAWAWALLHSAAHLCGSIAAAALGYRLLGVLA